MPEPLNALSALALARTTGCKVRPKDGWNEYPPTEHGLSGPFWLLGDIEIHDIINDDGTPVLWEIVEEGV